MEFSNTYVDLPAEFHERMPPSPVRAPRLFLFNPELAGELQLAEELAGDREALARFFSGNELLPGSEPLALAYAGHQFGNFVPQLGDGRAHLLGEVLDGHGRRRDLQLKGSGRTAYSRGGDGRCALGPAIREFVMSEALHALGVPTTRCLAVVTTGEPVFREGALPGAVVTRVAASHLRVGTFEYFAARQNHEALKTLADYAIQRHDPDLADEQSDEERYLALFDRVIERQLRLVVEWMRIGFIHGVMNTDNTAISGETIDYGPCAMINSYDPGTVFSSIDRGGRYAYGNQPMVAFWNLGRLADCLVPLVDSDKQAAINKLNPKLEAMRGQFEESWLHMMASKLGLSEPRPDDLPLVSSLLEQTQQRSLDYTLLFARLGRSLSTEAPDAELEGDLDGWYGRWRQRLADQETSLEEAGELMRRHNPVVIPRNHHVEAVIEQCYQSLDPAPAERLLEVLRSPYQESPLTGEFQDPPADGDRGYQTFCGT